MADTATVPPPTLYPNLAGADKFFKCSSLLPLIDVLGNENPVSMTVNNQPPGFAFIHTGHAAADKHEHSRRAPCAAGARSTRLRGDVRRPGLLFAR